jgi:hypothetical protein
MYDPKRDGPHVSLPTPQAYSWETADYAGSKDQWVLKLVYKDRAVIEKAMTALRVALEYARGERPAHVSRSEAMHRPPAAATDLAELADLVALIACNMKPNEINLEERRAQDIASRVRMGML